MTRSASAETAFTEIVGAELPRQAAQTGPFPLEMPSSAEIAAQPMISAD
jgi:hypothetical protein